ncbi:MAG: SH3 domain-containing protein, partial [Pirellulales bacterium]|nr:SH3 domain-containing protein [Pirellulales bacterium]
MDWLPFSTARLRYRATALCALLLIANSAYGELQFPYVAYVSQDGAYVRSGPGQRHYPTGQVPQGYAVEVYRHDGARWCAIRPTEDSFSWVAAHEVRLLNDQFAEVIAEQTVARVGSTISSARSAVQVLLTRGERVAIIAAQEDDDPRCLRIVAPAGEFRWMAAQHWSLQPPLEVAP